MEIRIYDKKKKKAEVKDISLDTLSRYLKKEKNYYIWIDAHFKERGYKKLLNLLALHPAVLEYAVTMNIRPQLQISKDILFSIFYLPYFEKKKIKFEEVNFILTANLLITITKEPNKLLTKILNQIKKHNYLDNGPDNLMGHIINYFCTEYYPITEKLEEQVEDLEVRQVEEKLTKFIKNLKTTKKLILQIKKQIVYQKTILEQITGRNIIFIDDKEALIDATHQTNSIFHSLENIDSTLNNILDTHLNIISTNMNAVMKILTIVAAIFMPLSFFTSWYGMNFYIPEIQFKYAYFIFIGFCTITTIIMIIIFKKKKWL